MSDRQPLLPTHHVNHTSASRLSTPRISFPTSSPPSQDPKNAKPGNTHTSRGGSGAEVDVHGFRGKREGLPKVSRECLWSEIKCYGSYMLPPLLVFGVLVVAASLIAVGWKSGWFS